MSDILDTSTNTNFRTDNSSGGLTSQLKGDATGIASDVKERARTFAEEQKNRGAERLETLAGTVQRAADGIEQEAPEAARYIRQAADGVQRFSTNIRDRSLEDVVSDATEFARRRPLVVIGGAVLAGLAISRFLKSSSDSGSNMSGSGRFDEDNFQGGRNVYE